MKDNSKGTDRMQALKKKQVSILEIIERKIQFDSHAGLEKRNCIVRF
jgi:hypothetical protein